MIAPRAYRPAAAVALVLLCSAALAAACAHVAIDLAGDVLLAHDAYDGVAHDARSVLGAGGLAAAFAAALRFLLRSLDGDGGGRRRLADVRRCLAPAMGPGFVAATVAAATAVLIGMEIVDQLAAGRAIDDLADLLGGSAALGLGIVAVIGTAIAALVGLALRWLLAVGAALTHAVAHFVRRSRLRLARHGARLRPRLARAAAAPLAHRLAKRGPPRVLVTAPFIPTH